MIGLDISREIKIKISNTPFYHFMRSRALVVDAYLLDDICGHYEGDDMFRFGDMEFTYLDEDFSRILGLPHGGLLVEIREVDYKSNFYDTVSMDLSLQSQLLFFRPFFIPSFHHALYI